VVLQVGSWEGEYVQFAHKEVYLELNGSSLLLLLAAQLEMLASFDDLLVLLLADRTFHSEDNFFRGFGFFLEDRLRLSTIARLLSVIASLAWQ